VDAKCKYSTDAPCWRVVGNLGRGEFETRRSRVLSLIEQKTLSFASQTSTGALQIERSDKNNGQKISSQTLLFNTPQPRPQTTYQTEESISREKESLKK